MANTHIEHPEDLVLTGDLSVFDLLYDTAHISMKMDGMSLVWGTNPANGEFFVCTKSAFNKKKIRLCYSDEDVKTHFGHQPEVEEILKSCLRYLPRTENIYWGDWLGFGGTDTFNQNTLVYSFPEIVAQNLVIAPHTQVYVHDELHNATCEPLMETFVDTNDVKWVQPSVDRIHQSTNVPKVNTDAIKFLSRKEAEVAKVSINKLIKEGQKVDDASLIEILGCPQLANLYQLVTEIKLDLMDSLIIADSPSCFLPNGWETTGEGYVFHSESYGSVKLVRREEFAYANFNFGYSS